MTTESGGIDFWNLLGKVADIVTILGFLGTILLAYLIRSLYIKKTDVGLIITKADLPNEKEINNALGLFKKINKTITLYDISPAVYDSNYVNKFISSNESKIGDLIASENVVSLFVFAHMPILVYIGNRLQDYKSVNLFHRLRLAKKNKWKWNFCYPFFLSNHNKKYLLKESRYIKKGGIATDVVLELSISSNISGKSIIPNYENLSRFRIELELNEGADIKNYLIYKEILTDFTLKYRTIIREIENTFGENIRIHLVLTTPAPFAVIVGQYIHPNGPELLVYDKNSERAYEVMCHLNKQNNI